MDEQLNYAPCGYISMDRNGNIIEMNRTLQVMLGKEQKQLDRQHIHSILTTPSRIYYQTYFLPLLNSNGKVEEIYLTIQGNTDKIPVLMNAIERERDGEKRVECILVEMKVRDEYENELIQEKRNAEQILRSTDKAYNKLQNLLKEVEEKKDELEKLNNQWKELALTDALTGLKNRRYFEKKLDSMINGNEKFSILLLDIDHFKVVNDTLGHQVGDAVLQEVSFKLQTVVKAEDTVIRFGGEEFIALLPGMNSKNAYELAERVRSSFERSEWAYTPITISIGLSECRYGDSAETLLVRADKALYESKELGRNRVTSG